VIESGETSAIPTIVGQRGLHGQATDLDGTLDHAARMCAGRTNAQSRGTSKGKDQHRHDAAPHGVGPAPSTPDAGTKNAPAVPARASELGREDSNP
jgi:hypothetical protein